MPGHTRSAAVLILLLSASTQARADISPPGVRLPLRTYTTSDGLPGDDITALLADSRGFLGVGTTTGLSRDDFLETDRDGVEYALVDYKPKPGRRELGYRERLEHVDLLRDGRKCLMVLCTAEDAWHHVPDTGVVRRIVAFDAQTVLVGDKLMPRPDGRVWMRIAGRQPAATVAI